MDLSKSFDVFNPASVEKEIHIVGCGSVGSTVAELLARYGLTKFTLWDMDVVEGKNIVNQMFTSDQIAMPKVEALRDIICKINPEAANDIFLKPNGWNGEANLSGYVFLAVDNIEIRKQFMEANKYNPKIQCVIDIRTGLFDAQAWSAVWSNQKSRENLMKSMNFSHEEATSETPVSACGVTLGVAPTVRFICTLAVTNFINFATGNGDLKKLIVADPFHLDNDGIVTAM